MRQLTIQAVSWCWRHGHPVATLLANDGGAPLTLPLAGDDAEALSPLMRSTGAGHAGARARTYELLDDVTAVLGGRLLGVLLHVDASGQPEAALSLESPFGVHTVPTQVVDALVLAWRHALPLLADACTLADLRAAGLAHGGDHVLDMAAGSAAHRSAAMHLDTDMDMDAGRPMPVAMQRFIESLDLSGLGG